MRMQAHIALTARGETWMRNLRIKGVAATDRPTADGWREYRIPIESIEHGARQLLSFGLEARVLGPPELRRYVIDAARGVGALYGNAEGRRNARGER